MNSLQKEDLLFNLGFHVLLHQIAQLHQLMLPLQLQLQLQLQLKLQLKLQLNLLLLLLYLLFLCLMPFPLSHPLRRLLRQNPFRHLSLSLIRKNNQLKPICLIARTVASQLLRTKWHLTLKSVIKFFKCLMYHITINKVLLQNKNYQPGNNMKKSETL